MSTWAVWMGAEYPKISALFREKAKEHKWSVEDKNAIMHLLTSLWEEMKTENNQPLWTWPSGKVNDINLRERNSNDTSE